MKRPPSPAALLLAAACASLVCAGAAQARLPAPVRAEMARVGIADDDIAVAALPLGFGLAWQHRGDVPMQPGSAMKLVTSVVALDRLGPLQHGRTDLLASASVTGDVLQGDLVLRGGADPELGLPELWALLLELREQGIRHIAGDVVVDRTLFRPSRPELGLPPFDEHHEFAYNVVPDALHLSGGLVGVQIRSDDTRIDARAWPALDGIHIESMLTPAPGQRCSKWDDGWQGARRTETADGTRVQLHGSFPPGCSQRTALQLVDRQRLVDASVRTLWRQLGGTWAGRATEGATPAGARVLASRQARSWLELLRRQNKASDNALSRLVFLQLGVPGMAAQPTRTTAQIAADVVHEWFTAHGIATAGLVLDNGSGLSRAERISARQLAQMLKLVHAGPRAADLQATLPVAGRDGTLRLRGSPAADVARLKTGTLRNAVALAGYVQDGDGRGWALAAIVNHEVNALAARAVLDALVDWFALEGPWWRAAPADGGP